MSNNINAKVGAPYEVSGNLRLASVTVYTLFHIAHHTVRESFESRAEALAEKNEHERVVKLTGSATYCPAAARAATRAVVQTEQMNREIETARACNGRPR